MSEHSTENPANSREAYSKPQTPARVGLAVIGIFIGIIVAWSALAPLSDAAIAQGSLQVEGRKQTVQHPYGGVVMEIDVAEGDRVEKGDVLIVLSDAIDLQAGMPVQVVMEIRSRTLIEYLTSPLLDEVATAFREP